MVNTGQEALDALLVEGFPERSAVLIIGPPGIGKEAILYSFLRSSLSRDDVGVYVSRRSVREVLEDAGGYGVALSNPLIWLDCSGAPVAAPAITCNLSDLTEISVTLKKVVAENASRAVRIVMDVLSPMLLLNPLETVYRFFNSLFVELKRYDTVTVTTLEEGMHAPKDAVAFEELFDGVIEMRLYEEALKVLPLLRVKKMRGLPPQPNYFNFHFTPTMRMETVAYAR